MEDIDKEISEMKISLNARARIVAEEFLKNVSTLVPGLPVVGTGKPCYTLAIILSLSLSLQF